MIVDCHCHWYPAAFFEAILTRRSYPRAQRDGAGGYLLELAPRASLSVGRHMVDLSGRAQHELAAKIWIHEKTGEIGLITFLETTLLQKRLKLIRLRGGVFA